MGMTTPTAPVAFRRMPVFLSLLCLMLTMLVPAKAAEHPKQQFDLPADTVENSLKRLSEQSGVEVLYPSNFGRDVRTNAVKGEFTPFEALTEMLAGTNLVAAQDEKTGALTVKRAAGPNAQRVAQSSGDRPSENRKAEIGIVKLDTFEVMESKLLNTDKPRSRDDAQPYVVFDHVALEQSGASNLTDFFKQRLPMDSNAQDSEQAGGGLIGGAPGGSVINLRGLGSNQTLILIDGHRQAGVSAGGSPGQPDLNGIPLSAVERIEILPATASGIYGGSAVGGVVNVILKRNYQATELVARYGNTFNSESATRQASFTFGRTWNKGRTNVMVVASWRDDDGLLLKDRDFLARGRAEILANNPSYFLSNTILGATPNIRSANGSPLFGPGTSSITSVPAGYAGSGGLAPLQANAGKYNLDLPGSAQNIVGGGRSNLLGAVTARSAGVTVRHDFSPSLQAFVDVGTSSNKEYFNSSNFDSLSAITVSATAPNNPFGQAIVVAVPTAAGDAVRRNELSQLRASAGAIVKLPWAWIGEFDYSYNRSFGRIYFPTLNATARTAMGNGTVDILRDTLAFLTNLDAYRSFRLSEYRSRSETESLRLGGPIGSLPAGNLNLSFLAESREDLIGNGGFDATATGGINAPYVTTSNYSPGKQSVDSVYTELSVPIFAEKNGVPLMDDLSLQLAGRADRYRIRPGPIRVAPGAIAPVYADVKRNSTDPTIGLRWRPVKDMIVRASYGTGFLPPSVDQIGAPVGPFAGGAGVVIDPKRGNTSNTTYQAIFAGNPNLQPEKSESWSAGIVLTPSQLGGLRLSLDYINIQKRDAVLDLSSRAAFLIANEANFPARVVRGPADGLYSVGPITFLDLTYLNAARAKIDAYDAQADYAFETASLGKFSFFALITWETHYLIQLFPGLPYAEQAGVTSANPLKFKGNAGVNWQLGQWSAGWSVRYFDSYFVADPALPASIPVFLNQHSQRVPSQAYQDIYAGYRFPAAGWRPATELKVGMNNVFNREPPADLSTNGGAALYSQYADPRLASYYMAVKVSF